MIIAIVAVGEDYSNKIEYAIDYLKDYDICLLTDSYKRNVFYYEKYNNEKFSYFDKLYFSLKMVNKFKTDVFYVDINKLDEINFDFPKDSKFYFKSHWPYGNNFKDYLKYNDYFLPFISYCEAMNVDYNILPAIRETELFFGKDIDTKFICKELKKLQPIFRTMSHSQTKYKGLDNGEGIALSFALKMAKII